MRREERVVGMMGREGVSNVVGMVGGRYISELWVCDRPACSVHLSRYVSLCGSYKITQGSGD